MEGEAKTAGDAPLNVSKLLPAEYWGFAAAAVLFVSLFLPWFRTTSDNAFINGRHGVFTAWEALTYIDILLAAACAAPFVLAWIIIRGHKLTWRPGEVTMIVGLIAVTLILVRGLIMGPPGDAPSGTVSLEYGYWIALLGAAGIVVSGFLRQSQSIKGRRPPGSFS